MSAFGFSPDPSSRRGGAAPLPLHPSLHLTAIRRTRCTSRSSLSREAVHCPMVSGTCREGDDGGRTKPLINLNLVGLGGGIQEFLIEDAQGVAPNPTGDALGCVPSTPHPSASLPMHALISILQRVFQHFRQSCRRTLPRAGWRLRAHTGGDILRNIVKLNNFRGQRYALFPKPPNFSRTF